MFWNSCKSMLASVPSARCPRRASETLGACQPRRLRSAYLVVVVQSVQVAVRFGHIGAVAFVAVALEQWLDVGLEGARELPQSCLRLSLIGLGAPTERAEA